jgi:tripartite-type tricarboxylate transporter receptor subunit TctC
MKTYLLKFRWHFVLSIFFLFLLSESGYPQEEEIAKYPSRPITFIHPFAAGTPIDMACRLITHEAEKFLGQPIAVVNKAGGSGSVGVAAIASSKPDGYTIGNAPASTVFVVPLLEKVPYHPVKDLRMILQIASLNIGVFVKPDSPFKSFKEIINYARQNPKKITHGTAGATSMQFLIMEQILMKEKVQFTLIPFDSATQTQTALLGGHVLIGSGDFSYSLLEAGQIRVLLLFREEPSVEYPNIPILKDLGYDFSTPYYTCVAGPKGLPEGIVKKLEEAFTKAMKEPAFIKGMKDLRLPIVYRNSKEMGEYVTHNYEAFSKLFKEIGLIK